jgi:RsiW-degrading membrane proteinase PrsW (M82 family)
MTVYFSIIWFFVFIKLFQYEGSNFKLHLGVYFFSLVSLSPSFHLIHSLTSPFYSFISSESAALRFLGFFAGVGITEELTKAVPIFILVVLTRRRGEQLSGMDYLLCGIMSGLAFAGVENFGYIRMAVIRDVLWESLGDGAVTSLVRSTLTPFIHSCLSGIFAYFIGLPSFYPSKSPWPFFLSGLLVSAFLHAVYDFAVASTIFSQPLAFLALAMMYMGLLICWLNLKTKFRRTQREEMDNYIKDII